MIIPAQTVMLPQFSIIYKMGLSNSYLALVLPLAKPVYATVGILVFIACWNDYVGPLMYLQDSKLYTLAGYDNLRQLQADHPDGSEQSVQYPAG